LGTEAVKKRDVEEDVLAECSISKTDDFFLKGYYDSLKFLNEQSEIHKE
jgi:hypothetical protein